MFWFAYQPRSGALLDGRRPQAWYLLLLLPHVLTYVRTPLQPWFASSALSLAHPSTARSAPLLLGKLFFFILRLVPSFYLAHPSVFAGLVPLAF